MVVNEFSSHQLQEQGDESKYGERLINEGHLITFPNPRVGRPYEIQVTLPEFTCKASGGSDGRYWIRTSDPFRVKEVRYRCANRPHSQSLKHGLPHLPSLREDEGPMRPPSP